ncbi:MAG: hypothetical protein GF398_02110 [Chitinivibrionales bacterium]|nr:hypothetical protein [Chitinivibrionales bacterium]
MSRTVVVSSAFGDWTARNDDYYPKNKSFTLRADSPASIIYINPVVIFDTGLWMSAKTSITRGISIAVRHPQIGAELLARSYAHKLNQAPWFDRKMKIELSLLVLGSCLGGRTEPKVGKRLFKRVKKRPLEFGIRYLKRDSYHGLRMLAALLMDELRNNQHLSNSEIVEFSRILIREFLPDIELVED